jgi:hypothetical protein
LLGATSPPKKIRGKAYFGWRLTLPSRDAQPLFARLYLSPAGTRLNLPGAPDALIAAPERDANGSLEPRASLAAVASGFARTKDLDGFWLHRRIWPLDGVDARDAAGQIAEGFTRTGLVADAAGRTPFEGGFLAYEGHVPVAEGYWPTILDEDGNIIEHGRAGADG